MSEDKRINLEYIARVEGYGQLVVDIENQQLKEAQFRVLEGARFFEGIVSGKKHHEVPIIISRICAICSVSHSVVSTRAIERAIGVEPSEQTHALRKLLIYSETIQSHVLHEYFLALPDYLGKTSAIDLASTHPELVAKAFYGKKLGNDMQRIIGGRAIHPIRNVIGGFSKFATTEELTNLRDRLPQLIDETMETIKILASLPDQPTIGSRRDFVAIHDPSEYAYYDTDQLISGHSGPFPAADYQEHLLEEIRPYSHTKFSTLKGESFMVGALPRLNLNHANLTETGKEAFEYSRLILPDYDTFHNNMAQLIETVDCAQLSINLLDRFIADGFEKENFEYDLHPGNGTAATEAPRGLLIHQYTFDEDLRCSYSDVITPTAFNQLKMETDCEDLVPRIATKPKEEIELLLNMLVRAYDPCISCSAHSMKVDVKFV
ncbi:MAG: Ni/Fe hydrogenase subunit alpha [Candidatus Heimdallarchaeota archaeon]|nr:Ni/Fe hydrogenase subunit alpha [Candidatus Heimdallarchaeota archaeon]MCK5048412.1 Ni/Fe hydrogenase subunit alpha [Candidatus Heimdallarchaeota archaeon]